MSSLIEFKRLEKDFKKNSVLKNINLKIQKGDLFGIIGVSGAGKTTLLRCLIGFYRINKGQVLFEGKNISKNLRKIRNIFGFASQDNCFYEDLTVEENLRYFGRMYGVKRKKIAENTNCLIELVELKKARKTLAKNLSGGMQRRLDLACSMMHDPKILILDEPTAGLDPILRKHMWKLIKKIHESGTTIIVSTHLLSEIEHVCNKISILSEGQIIVVDSPDKLKELYSKNEEIVLETFPGNYKKIIAKLKTNSLKISKMFSRDHQLVIYSSKAEHVLSSILDTIKENQEKLMEVSVNKPSLDEVFEALTSKKRSSSTKQGFQHMLKYVGDARKHGFSDYHIKEALLLKKWPEKDINKALKEKK